MSHPIEYIPVRSRLVVANPPIPVRPRSTSLAITPAARVIPVWWSPIPERGLGGSAPGGTSVWARPDRAQ